MSLNSLGKNLVKEFKRSPAKSTVLALMVPIAFYFWVPLLTKGWKKSPKPVSTAAVNSAATPASIDEASVVAATATTNANGTPTWTSLVKWMAVDGLTKSATIDTEARNPFQKFAKKQTEETAIESTTSDVVAEAIDPQSLALNVDTIVVGGRLRTATINGRTFREGDRLKLDGTPVKRLQKFDPATTLVVASIESKKVVLNCGEQKFELELKPLTALSAVELK